MPKVEVLERGRCYDVSNGTVAVKYSISKTLLVDDIWYMVILHLTPKVQVPMQSFRSREDAERWLMEIGAITVHDVAWDERE